MKKIITLFTVIVATLLFSGKAFADDYEDFTNKGFGIGRNHDYVGVLSREKDTDVRAFELIANSPLSSYAKSLHVFLKPGESFTITSETLQVEGYRNATTVSISKESSSTGSGEFSLPYTVKYEDLEDPLVNIDGRVIPTAIFRIMNEQISSEYKYRSIPVYRYVDGQEESLASYVMYSLPGRNLPVIKKFNGKNYQGSSFALSKGLTRKAYTPTFEDNEYYTDKTNRFLVFFDNKPSLKPDEAALSGNTGYWEGIDFSSIPGAIKPITKSSSETENSSTEEADEEEIETDTQSVEATGEQTGRGVLMSIAVLFVGFIGSCIFVVIKMRKK